MSYFLFNFPKQMFIENKKKWVLTLLIDDIGMILGHFNNNVTKFSHSYFNGIMFVGLVFYDWVTNFKLRSSCVYT